MTFYVKTDYPIAADSPDHTHPRATWRDNSINPAFNRRLMEIYKSGRKPSVLDLGCAGGGLVHSLLRDGCEAVGLEGSDYNREHGRHEWPAIPDNLFTCDVSRPFTVHTGNGRPYRFDVITAWEFLEHIPEDRLPQLFENIRKHLKEGGLVIGSTTETDSLYDGIEHHQTRKPFWWWAEMFGRYYFKRRPDLEFHFKIAQAWVRSVQFNFVFQEDET